MTDGAVDVPDNSNHPATHILALTKRINKLLERVAKQEADNTKLQREKTTAKEANRDLHSRLSQITQALGALNVSYAKRLEEKNVVVHENTSIEQHNTSLREELTGYLRQVCELEIKVQIMEGEAEEAKAEKEGLQKRVTELEAENETLRRQNRKMEAKKGEKKEAKKEERDTSEDAVQDLWNRSRSQGTTRRLGGGEAYTPRYDNDKTSRDESREKRKHGQQDFGEYSAGDTYRPRSKQDKGDRDERCRSSYKDRENDWKPPSGPKAERR